VRCPSCDVQLPDPAPAACPHCGAALTDLPVSPVPVSPVPVSPVPAGPATVRRRSLGATSHRPASYSSAASWFLAGVVRDWRGSLAAMFAGWFGVPVAITLAFYLALVGSLAGLIGGALGANSTLQDVPVFGDVLDNVALQAGGGVGALAGAALGLVAGLFVGLGLPWLVQYTDDPVATVLVLLLQVAAAILIGLLYVAYGIVFEPWRLRVGGARRMSRREQEYLLPILHDCAARLGLPNVPRLLVDDSREANALAYTRHVVVNRGLLNEFDYDQDVVAGILSHELVHWHNADGVSRLFLRGVALPLYLAYSLATWIMRVFDNSVVRFLVIAVSWPITVTIRFLVMPVQSFGAREAEYRADQGAVVAGQRDGLRRALERFQRSFDSSRNGWDRAVCASHPPSELRLERLERPGEAYPLRRRPAERPVSSAPAPRAALQVR